MMSIPTARANSLLDANHAVGSYTALTAPMRIRLDTGAPSAASAGTEVATGGGYTSGGGGSHTVTFGAASAASCATSTAYTVTNYPRAETVSYIDIYDSTGTPVRTEYGTLTTPKVMAAADTFSIAIGALTSALA